MIRRAVAKRASAAAAFVLGLALIVPATAAADSSAAPNGCHAFFLHMAKDLTGNNSTAASVVTSDSASSLPMLDVPG